MKKVILIFVLSFFMLAVSACDSSDGVDNIKSTSVDVKVNNEESEVVAENIEQEICKKELKEELIATNSTTFSTADVNRRNNIELAGNIINGTVLQPNEEFSFNNIVGERTSERGFLPAGIFVSAGSEVITTNGIGGGICQTSSTVCGAVLETTMEILERSEHSKRVSYTTRDKEAMINWGTSDFRFKNNYEFPVKVEILFEVQESSEIITCNIFSLKYE